MLSRVVTLAVTGGIGAGKSTVTRTLAELGAIVVDSDQLARDVVGPGTPGLAEVIEAFGEGVLASDGSLNRAALADIVFSDDVARARLEGIIHPRVRAEFRRIKDAAAPGSVVVNDIPILRTRAQADEFDHVVVVTAPVEERVTRLIERGLAEDDARARIAAQITDTERAALADVVIPNDRDEDALRTHVLELWKQTLSDPRRTL